MKKIIAFLLAFLLTGTLALFGACFTASLTAAPAMREGGAPVSSQVLAQEQELIKKRITDLAGLYGFSPEPVIAFVDGNTMAAMNQESALWWNSVLTAGNLGKAPSLDKRALVQILRADTGMMEGKDETDQEILADEAAEAVSRSVTRVVLPLRQEVVSIGLEEAAKRVDVPNVIAFLMDLHWILLALAALLAGLIALLESRRLRSALPYIGSAMGAAVLVMLAGVLLIPGSGIGARIREASESLSIQAGSLFSGFLLRFGALCAVLLAGCILCLTLCRRTGKKHEA